MNEIESESKQCIKRIYKKQLETLL